MEPPGFCGKGAAREGKSAIADRSLGEFSA
jgi:hypothetical protein